MPTEDTDFELLSLVCLETLDDFTLTDDVDLEVEAIASEEMARVGALQSLSVSPFYLDGVESGALMLPLSSSPPQVRTESEQLQQQPSEEVERVVVITPRNMKRKREAENQDELPESPVSECSSRSRRRTSMSSSINRSPRFNSRIEVHPELGLLKRVDGPFSQIWCSYHCDPSAEVRVCNLSGYQMFEIK